MDQAHAQGFKVLVAARGADALALAREYHPTAISLDVFLPDMLGWTVLNQLKQDPALRHIPVQIVTLDEDRQHGLARGAFSFLPKPTTTEGLDEALSRMKDYASPACGRLLVVEDNEAEQMSIAELLGHDDVEIETVGTGAEALAALRAQPYDCAVLDLRLPDMSGFDVLEHIRDDSRLCRPARWWCSPARSSRPRRTPGSTPWPAASWSRASSRPSGCWTRPRSSCTGSSPTCRRRSSRCSTGSIAPTTTWSARRCWWWTTTSGTSSR